MMRYIKHLGTKKTKQTREVLGMGQVRNDAGGYVWAMDRWALLERFLILGTEGGTYFVREGKLTRDHAKNLELAIAEDGERVVETISQISGSGRAAKNDPALFALAMTASFGDEKTRIAAYAALPRIVRTGTQLFQFVGISDELRGWGRGLRRVVGSWYTNKVDDDLVYQLVKYRQREGWSHADVLRLAHAKPANGDQSAIFKWAITGLYDGSNARLQAFMNLQSADSIAEVVRLVTEHDLPREAVPTEFLTEPQIWAALLEKMPMTAMLRSLGTMTKIGLLQPQSSSAELVCSRLLDAERLKAARVHPLAVLIALRTYESGRGLRGSGTWTPTQSIVQALDRAFYLAFDSIEATGKRMVLGLDVSGSMTYGRVAGAPVTPNEAAAAMSMVTIAAERSVQTMAFAHEFHPLRLKEGMSLQEACSLTQSASFGGTDCALPMIWARKNKIEADLFVVYTDNETWYGDTHPFQALRDYRQATGIPAKLAVVAMSGSEFSIADPDDPGMLDFVGFDTSVPAAMREFSLA